MGIGYLVKIKNDMFLNEKYKDVSSEYNKEEYYWSVNMLMLNL